MKKFYRIGCVGLLSDIPLYVAQAKGMFTAEGVNVAVSTELGWASIESRFATDKISAANVPAVMPLAISLRLGKTAPSLRALAITCYQAEAITLSPDIHAALKAGKSNSSETIRIGVEFPYSFSTYFLQTWLKQIQPDWRARVVPVPLAVSQIIDFLKDGYIQGFCCSEPVAQIAAQAGLGVTTARSRDFFPGHLQSVIAVSETLLAADEAAARAIATAVERARQFCAQPENHAEALHIFLEQKSSAFALSGVSPGAVGSTIHLGSLIAFESNDAVSQAGAGDPLEHVVKACAALPGTTLSEREIRDEAKRVFSGISKKQREKTS